MKASVCITTYNHEKYIEQAILSVVNQKTNFEFEVLVGEDKSEDKTRQRVARLAKEYPEKIKPFFNDRKDVIYIYGKPTGRRNLLNLFKHASGEYVAYLDGDDYWLSEDKLQKQVDYLDEHDDCSMCFNLMQVLYKNRLYEGTFPPIKRSKYTQDQVALYSNFINATTYLLRNVFLEGVPKWLEEVPCFDHALHLYITRNAYAGIIPEYLSVYRQHSKGISSGNNTVGNEKKHIDTLEILQARTNCLDNSVFNECILRRYLNLVAECSRQNDTDGVRHYYQLSQSCPSKHTLVKKTKLVLAKNTPKLFVLTVLLQNLFLCVINYGLRSTFQRIRAYVSLFIPFTIAKRSAVN